MCGSFHRAPQKIKRIYYKDTKEKDQMIFFICAFFLSHRALSLNNINTFFIINKLDDDIAKK